ncbi:hypothetical protein GSI_14310 [Ganoderma sinense ZZ0214-1]|uniref:Uncharacterized protein n=1 Tax=Ganoderma sinense ZZ0214-1 TaxID=1077348 RepID=A0A2G8RNC4_9APHY|nr:hypothetical protein GSI_14310 [Ganoderma sinense ZZ0214-1]
MVFSEKSPPHPFFATRREMTIDALQLISDEIASQVRTLVHSFSQREANCKHPDTTLRNLYTAFGEGLAIVAGLMNAAAPINRIPQELLTTIFALSHETHPPKYSQTPYWPFEPLSAGGPHQLPKVCRHWRELALQTPTLWNTVVTVLRSQEDDRDYCFGRSIYSPKDSDISLGLNVHFAPGPNPRALCPQRAEKMIQFMLTNSPKIRQLHAWDASSIPDLPSFLQSFDANALEHCAIVQNTGRDVLRDPSPKPGRLLFFSNGGARLRSLCLLNIRDIPDNEFPSLTLLEIGFDRELNVRWEVEDLVEFLAGSPKLEEVYLHYISYWDQHAHSHKDTVSLPPVSFPHLQYLAFTCLHRDPNRELDVQIDNPANPIDYLLSRISIPPTCHMYLDAPVVNEPQAVLKSVTDTLASVCRRVPGKHAVSHMFLRLSNPVQRGNPIQLVFQQGSLRLQIPKFPDQPEGMNFKFPYPDFFRTFRDLFATTTHLRVHYTRDAILTAFGGAMPWAAAVFPSVTAMSLIPDSGMWLSPTMRTTLRAGIAHLVRCPQPHWPEPPASSVSPSGLGSEEQSEEHSGWPYYPALDTLWTSVDLELTGEIEELETALAARAAQGMPIRRLIVTLRYSAGADWDSDGVERLRELKVAGVEDVVVMDGEASSNLEAVDWLVRLPERYDLPSSIRRDWPTLWDKQW